MTEIAKPVKKTTKKKARRKIKTKIVSIILIIVAITIFTKVGKQVYQMLQLQKKAELVETELKNLQDENASLLTIKTKLEDPNYVTTYARGEYMFSKGDEKLFYLPATTNNEEVIEEQEETKETSNEEEKPSEETQDNSQESE